MKKTEIKTEILKELVARAIKGASKNKLIPITSLMEICVKDNTLSLMTTNGANYLKVMHGELDSEDFYVVVEIDTFSKLVSKTTSDKVVLTQEDTNLHFKGNGNYTIKLPVDENGQAINFPHYHFEEEGAAVLPLNNSTLKHILATHKSAVASSMEVPCLTGYWFGNKVLTTDSFVVCCSMIDVMQEHPPILIHSELMDLLAVLNQEHITLKMKNDQLLFETTNAVIYGQQLSGIEDYPVEGVESYLDTAFEQNCTVSKASILSVIDRLKLFITPYDSNAVCLTFTAEGLQISSKKATGSELIPYESSENFTPYQVNLDVEMLKAQINAVSDPLVTIWYGSETAIKLTSGNQIQIIALLEDE